MNERILKLAKQSLPAFYLTNCPSALEKFAELIVQECLNICEEMGDNGKDGHYCADEISRKFFPR
jgi:hypothetical protein